MIILRAKKKKQFTKARSQDLRACDGEVEGDLKTSGTGIREACNYHLGGGGRYTGQTRGYRGGGTLRTQESM